MTIVGVIITITMWERCRLTNVARVLSRLSCAVDAAQVLTKCVVVSFSHLDTGADQNFMDDKVLI